MPIGTALVGFGYAGQTFHVPLLDATDGLTLRAVVSSHPDLVAARCPDTRVIAFDELLADRSLALVVVATPNRTHAELAIPLLRAGKHVVVDKPMAASVAEAEQMDAVARETGRMLTVFHNRRWDADFLTLRALMDAGRLGRVSAMEAHWDRYRPRLRDRWRDQPGQGSGTWFDLGAHLVDQALLLFGPPGAVWADLESQRGGSTDYFDVILRYGTVRVALRGSSVAIAPRPRFRVVGSEAVYEKEGLDTQEAALRARRRPGDRSWGDDPSPGRLVRVAGETVTESRVPNHRGDYLAFYRRLHDAIVSNAEPPVAAVDALRVMRILEQAERSSRERRELMCG